MGIYRVRRGFQRKIVAVGCRYGCNQRDDNRYYRVNPTHPADLGWRDSPPASIRDWGPKRLVWRVWCIPLPSVLFISRKRRSWNTQPWNRNQAVDPWIFTPLVFDLGAAINRGNDAEWLILPEPRARVKRRAASRTIPVDHGTGWTSLVNRYFIEYV